MSTAPRSDAVQCEPCLRQAAQQLPGRDLEPRSDLRDRREAHIPRAALYAPELDRMDPGTLRGFLLRDTQLGAASLDVRAHALPWLHAGMLGGLANSVQSR